MVIHKPNHSICVVIVTSFNNGWTWSIKPGYKPEHVPLVGCEWLLLISDRIGSANSNTQQHLKKTMQRKRGTMFLGKRVSWNWMQMKLRTMYEVKLKQEVINWHLFIRITLSKYVRV